MTWKVKYFQTVRGDYPVVEFIEALDPSTRAKVGRSIRLLVNYGPFIKPPYNKKLGPNFYELRTQGVVAIRIFYTAKRNEYYLVHAFKKKTQKTPPNELQTALDRAKEII